MPCHVVPCHICSRLIAFKSVKGTIWEAGCTVGIELWLYDILSYCLNARDLQIVYCAFIWRVRESGKELSSSQCTNLTESYSPLCCRSICLWWRGLVVHHRPNYRRPLNGCSGGRSSSSRCRWHFLFLDGRARERQTLPRRCCCCCCWYRSRCGAALCSARAVQLQYNAALICPLLFSPKRRGSGGNSSSSSIRHWDKASLSTQLSSSMAAARVSPTFERCTDKWNGLDIRQISLFIE